MACSSKILYRRHWPVKYNTGQRCFIKGDFKDVVEDSGVIIDSKLIKVVVISWFTVFKD